MRYGVFSDVHSNLEALEAVLSAMASEGIEKYLCLGDTVGYAANPNECLDRIRRLPVVVVAGNHDLAAIGHPIREKLYPLPRLAAEWTSYQLREEHKAWLATLPLVTQIESATMVHSSLEEPEEFYYITNNLEMLKTFYLMTTPLCFIGHSHFPWIMEEGARFTVSEMVYSSIKKYLINVGSVGQPRDGDNRASFCIWDSDEKQITLKRISYDIKRAQEKILATALPRRFAERLEAGE